MPLWYGEEIGMETMPAGELRLVATGPKRPRADDRDGERTPMQWDAGVNAGFSKGSPWLPVGSAYKRDNVQTEKEEPDSLYSWYANLIKLRDENLALRGGSYVPLDSGNRDVFIFGRRSEAKEFVLVALNTSAREQQISITGMPGDWPASGKVLMTSPPANAPTSHSFKVAPYGVLIAEFR